MGGPSASRKAEAIEKRPSERPTIRAELSEILAYAEAEMRARELEEQMKVGTTSAEQPSAQLPDAAKLTLRLGTLTGSSGVRAIQLPHAPEHTTPMSAVTTESMPVREEVPVPGEVHAGPAPRRRSAALFVFSFVMFSAVLLIAFAVVSRSFPELLPLLRLPGR